MGSQLSWPPAWLGPWKGLVRDEDEHEGEAEVFSSLSAWVAPLAVVRLLTQTPTARTHGFHL